MQNSSIEWTDHTFNPWWGCQRVSPGCEHCYAETLAHRYNFKVWGPAKTTGRREMSANYWKQPIKWNDAARKAGKQARVFCASMADVFEDHPQLEWPRTNLWGLIETTPHLDWLLLTKRPQNILRMLPSLWSGRTPDNVWLGTSCEDQQRADERIPHLLSVPARVRFLSCEPLLGEISLPISRMGSDIHWVIAGGESGAGARPMHPDWARWLRTQCQETGTAFHFKQWGAWVLRDNMRGPGRVFVNVGKHAAGRLLDDREWNELPA
jgi:protein gp37